MRWNGFWFFIIILALLGTAVGFLAGWAKKNHRIDIMKKLIWIFWIFITCCNFPLWNGHFPPQWSEIFTFVSTYGVIAAGLYGVYGEDQGPVIYPRLVLFTILGMLCRYFLELGEVSNTYNFTLIHIIIYLFAVPVFTLLSYEFVDRAKGIGE